MVELTVELEGPAAVGIDGQREDSRAVGRGRQHVAGDVIGHQGAIGMQRRQARSDVAEAEGQRSIGACIEQRGEAAGDAARGRAARGSSPFGIVVVAVRREAVLVDLAGDQRRRIPTLFRRDRRLGRWNVVVERDRQRAIARVVIAVVRGEGERGSRVILGVRPVIDLQHVVEEVDRIGPVAHSALR